MTILTRLEQWKEQGTLSPEQHAHLAGLCRREPVSLFVELNILLYAGVLAFVAGLGWTVSTWSEQLGDVLVLTVLSSILAACFWYCFSRAPAWSPTETPAPNPIFDYVLYLGSLIWSLELAYLENRFHLLSGQLDFYLLATGGLFFFLAYRFDNRFVLSLGLSSLAGWFGLTISHWAPYQDAAYRQYALLYCLLVSIAGTLGERRGLKPHFLATYLNIVANVLFWALLSGVFNRQGYGIWLVALFIACSASLAWGLRRRHFAFVAYAAVYGYVGVSSMFLRNVTDETAVLGYFVVTGVTMLVALVQIGRRFGEAGVRLYSASQEETLRTRKSLADWAGKGLLTRAQYERLQQETVSDLRTTNFFLRLVLFLFTLISVGAAAALFSVVFLSRPSEQITGVFCLILAVACYVAAEVAVSRARLYQFGIEEALVVCSVGFLCAGMQAAFFPGGPFSPRPEAAQFLVPATGAVFSLWIWRRFGLVYAFVAAMIFVLFLPGYWTLSPAAEHGIVAVIYATGLAGVAALRSRHRLNDGEDTYSPAEALLWLGIYLALNLQLSSLNLSAQWRVGVRDGSEFARPFYWTTWVLIWCLPPIVLVRGVRGKDRPVMAAGAIIAILTLISNKPYLGWQRHSWDPMFLGLLLTGVALFIRSWLARGPAGIRHGFTAGRLSGKDEQRINAGSSVFGLLSPHSRTAGPQASGPEVRFGGGQTGGGGAGGDF